MLRLREQRKNRGLTLRDMEILTDIAHCDLSLIERGLEPAWPGWPQRLARVLRVSERVFFCVSNRAAFQPG